MEKELQNYLSIYNLNMEDIDVYDYEDMEDGIDE